jgi:hypothetical protein
MTSRNTSIKNYKDLSSSDEMIIDIEHLSQIPTQTSKWDSDHVIALNIEYKNVENIMEIIDPRDLNENDNFKKLILKNWNRQDFLNANNNDYKNIKISKIITIMRKIKNVLKNEDVGPTRETKVDSFIMTLLDYLGFDEEPFLMHPQYDYSVYVDNDLHKITSKVEFMITKEDTYVVLIVEDKHPRNVSELSDWSEPQIAGEIFGAAYHNIFINDGNLIYPFNIYAIRVIGTKITFYKSIITREYLKEAQKTLPKKNKLEIKRFPQQPDSSPNQSRKLEALDFTNEKDRISILSIFKGLYEINK